MVALSLPSSFGDFDAALQSSKRSRAMPGSINFADSESSLNSPDVFSPQDRHPSDDVSLRDGRPSSPISSVLANPSAMMGGADHNTQAQEQVRRRTFHPEMLVMVRPSGRALQQHPHNLQVQLLSPVTKSRSPERGATLSRSSSRSNERSEISGQTTQSGRSGSSGRNGVAPGSRITPLYNLDYHQIRTTAILDASTDQRVAKVTKRGIELEDFGLLQPQELVFGVNDVASSRISPDVIAEGSSMSATRRVQLIRRFRGLHEQVKKLNDRESGTSSQKGRSRSQSSPPTAQSLSNATFPMTPGAGRASGHVTEGYFWEIKQLNRGKLERNENERPAGPVATLDKIWSRFNTLHLAGEHVETPEPDSVPVRFEWIRDIFTDTLHDSPIGTPSVMSPRGSPDGRSSTNEETFSMRRIADIDRDTVDASAWTCSLVLGEHTYIPIGHLSPVRHHPMLVAQLVLPYPLPDLSYSGLAADHLGFTREELKDIVVTTALHLAIRESMNE
ncbi:hypothetical protein MCUN1_002400 [Malassezia cuniculi]|uniref:Uncharacterized protein n=1 Tax=Malassezia cuniculi TaxID=948313 RepID=A0AAF0EUU1_9BASI|nr:hypothetical protein MCUN1_002400 [Malassezia cuniculi]